MIASLQSPTRCQTPMLGSRPSSSNDLRFLCKKRSIKARQNPEDAQFCHDDMTTKMSRSLANVMSVIVIVGLACSHTAKAADLAGPSVGLERRGTNVLVRFIGTLETATNVMGPYQAVPRATSPHLASTTNSPQFWRAAVLGDVAAMLQALPALITSFLAENQSLLAANPGLTSQLQAKIEMLQNPALASDIINGEFYSEGSVTSKSAKKIPIAAVFAQADMRADAVESVRSIELAVPILESFMHTEFPTAAIRIWYGFKLGNTGGGGTIYTEDRSSYESRTGPNPFLPFESILHHELSHSYFGHESLTQFLELYIYNLIHTQSTNVQSWITKRNWVAGSASNEGVHALLDIYQLIGPMAMANAYRMMYPLRPPYGQPLTAQGQQAFVDQAPLALKTQVAAKAARIR